MPPRPKVPNSYSSTPPIAWLPSRARGDRPGNHQQFATDRKRLKKISKLFSR